MLIRGLYPAATLEIKQTNWGIYCGRQPHAEILSLNAKG